MMAADFDEAAARYDNDFTDSCVGRAQRRLVWHHLDAVLRQVPAPASVLEINCGTGEDALWLASRGHGVLATDISAGMLAVAARKAAQAGGNLPLSWARLSAQELDLRTVGGPVDLVLSNFGGLNCLSPDQMAALARRLATLVRPGGWLVMVIMPPFCLWETAWNLLSLRPGLAARRWWRGPVTAQVGSARFPIWYYGAGRLRRLFADGFNCRAVRPIGLAVPPSALEGRFRPWPRLVAGLEGIDRRLGRSALMAALSDHMLLEFRRRA